MNKRKCLWPALFFLIFGFLVTSCSQLPEPKKSFTDLIWPPPPDVPRIRFIVAIRSEEDITGPQKRSLKDILLGVDKKKNIRKLRKPYGLCTDSKGRIYVADSGQAVVFVFDRKNKQVTFIGSRGQGSLSWPMDVVIDREDNVFISDARRKNVYIYNPEGGFMSALGRKGDFINPTGLAVDHVRERILVADSKAHQVKVYTLKGKFVASFGERGIAEGEFNFPTNVAVGKDGYVYVVDTGNHRIQVFNRDYEYYDDFGTLGTDYGQFRRPKGIALDSDNNIYVIDSDFNHFQIFDQDYNILMPVGMFGFEPGQFSIPAGVHIDENDRIYIADSANGRIQIFQYLKHD